MIRFNVRKVLLVLILTGSQLFPQEIKIWPDKPLFALTQENMLRAETDTFNITRYYDITIPTLEYIKPENPNGTAVIICPGGGYARLAYTKEGTEVGQWFAERGISAFILKYRLPNDKYMTYKESVPLADLQQSINYLKTHADEYELDSSRIGVIGFSAGGHLVSTASTHFDLPVIEIKKGINLRPAFSILIYPVISMDKEFTHSGSRNKLIGEDASEQLIDAYSNEKHITKNTPPTFLVHATDDKSVPVKNSLVYYESLVRNNVTAAMHIFEKGGHGFAMRNEKLDEQWLYLLEKWLRDNNLSGR